MRKTDERTDAAAGVTLDPNLERLYCAGRTLEVLGKYAFDLEGGPIDWEELRSAVKLVCFGLGDFSERAREWGEWIDMETNMIDLRTVLDIVVEYCETPRADHGPVGIWGALNVAASGIAAIYERVKGEAATSDEQPEEQAA